jgi:hypothetical protein
MSIGHALVPRPNSERENISRQAICALCMQLTALARNEMERERVRESICHAEQYFQIH